MKKLFGLFALCAIAMIAAPAFGAPPGSLEARLRLSNSAPMGRAQEVQTRSVELKAAPDGTLGLTYLYDGLSGYAGISLRALRVRGNLSLNGLVVTSAGSTYVGGLALYRVYSKGDWSASVGVGAKGLDLSGFDFGTARQGLLGVQISGRI